MMAEFVESESNFRKVKKALVSRSIHIGSLADLKKIAKLFVRTGSTRSATSSDLWQYFGPLCCIIIVFLCALYAAYNVCKCTLHILLWTLQLIG